MFQSGNLTGTIRPLQDWIVLRPEKAAMNLKGIHLPANAKEFAMREYRRCEVVAVGPGRRTSLGVLIPCEVKVGEFAFLQAFAEGDYKFRLNGAEVFAMRERHLNVTIEGDVDKPKTKAKRRR